MQDQMELLLKASESLSELYSHDFYPPPPPMNAALPPMPTECKHSSHKWELKAFQLLFSREIERSEWNQERQGLIKENQMLLNQLMDTRELLIRSVESANHVQNSLFMNSINQGFDQLLSKCDKLENEIKKLKMEQNKGPIPLENQELIYKLKQLKKWSETILNDDQI